MQKITKASVADLAAVKNFWYQVYVEEMGRHIDDELTNHAKKELGDPLLELGSVLIARDDQGNVVGTVVNTLVGDHNLGKYTELYGLDALTPLECAGASITTKLMVKESLRKSRLPVDLVKAAYQELLDQGIVDNFIDCNDHLVDFFTRFGYRNHLGRIDHVDYGTVNSLRLTINDGANLKATKSPFYRNFIQHQIRVSLPSQEITLEQNEAKDANSANSLRAHEVLQATFDSTIDEFNNCVGMQRLWRDELDKTHYAGLMREIFHHSRENPQLQALATVFFRGPQRGMVKPFLRHAISEVGHDQLALSDAAAVGMDVSAVPTQRPLPATTALIAFPFYQINNQNALGYLGYLYFLESMPTSFGAQYQGAFNRMGVTEEAMTFLCDHTTIDVGHTQAMQGYISALVKTPADLAEAQYAMRVTGELYGKMLTAAFASADVSTISTQGNFGVNTNEAAA